MTPTDPRPTPEEQAAAELLREVFRFRPADQNGYVWRLLPVCWHEAADDSDAYCGACGAELPADPPHPPFTFEVERHRA